jgi:hypothetical protein
MAAGKKPAQCAFDQMEQKIDRTLLSELELNGAARVRDGAHLKRS